MLRPFTLIAALVCHQYLHLLPFSQFKCRVKRETIKLRERIEDSHVRILERRRGRVERQPRGWFHCGIGEIQLQSFTFT